MPSFMQCLLHASVLCAVLTSTVSFGAPLPPTSTQALATRTFAPSVSGSSDATSFIRRSPTKLSDEEEDERSKQKDRKHGKKIRKYPGGALLTLLEEQPLRNPFYGPRSDNSVQEGTQGLDARSPMVDEGPFLNLPFGHGAKPDPGAEPVDNNAAACSNYKKFCKKSANRKLPACQQYHSKDSVCKKKPKAEHSAMPPNMMTPPPVVVKPAPGSLLGLCRRNGQTGPCWGGNVLDKRARSVIAKLGSLNSRPGTADIAKVFRRGLAAARNAVAPCRRSENGCWTEEFGIEGTTRSFLEPLFDRYRRFASLAVNTINPLVRRTPEVHRALHGEDAPNDVKRSFLEAFFGRTAASANITVHPLSRRALRNGRH
ncbi:hypothetical protein IE81DRAFT_329076 [Ceraceosorus guamensis]|uniref:C3H1-type domain-containing protein n=1 Tax=Ceraceosorus guamensis TaxID=1522189 RepID=A0A316W3K9_9BASI|nr:hypothetical protein IE81DRAFT_329076 [Ceraceosorus guamensis]PWN44104.1 hypothetical protein IE81DRAFT_329076 [Ceraceosorus guamensis]